MTYTLENAIGDILDADDTSVGERPVPSEVLIEDYQRRLSIVFPSDYQKFLKTVSRAFVGTLSPMVLSEGMDESYGDLISGFKEARSIGVPKEWIPFCEDNGDFYCLLPDGRVSFFDHSGPTDENWASLPIWMRDVWLEEG